MVNFICITTILAMSLNLSSQDCGQFNVSTQINGTIPHEENISNYIALFNGGHDTLKLKYTIGEVFVVNDNALQLLLKNFQDSIIKIEFLFDKDLTGLKKKYSINIRARNLFQRYCVLTFTDIKTSHKRKRLKRIYFAEYFSPLETRVSPK